MSAAYYQVDDEATYSEVKQIILSWLEVTAEASKMKLRKMKFQLRDDIRKYVAQVRVLAKWWLIPAENPDVADEDSKWRLEQYVVQEIVMEQTQSGTSRELHARIDARGPK